MLCCVSSALEMRLFSPVKAVGSSVAHWLVGERPKYPGWKIWKERQREAAVSGWPSELSYRCYDLSSCLFPLVFSVSPFLPFALGALGGFIILISHRFFSLLFFALHLFIFFWFGWWYLSYCQASGLAHMFVCIRASVDKWRRVFMPWFWSALVGEVDVWVRLVWPSSPYWTPSLISMQHSGRVV